MEPKKRRVLQPVSISAANIPQPLQDVCKSIAATPRDKLRPGRKPKSLENRIYKPAKRIVRIKRSYAREKTVEVLMFLLHHRLPKGSGLRTPTQVEASKWFKIPQRSIAVWWQNRDLIVGQKIGARRLPNASWLCMWPELEIELFQRFISERCAGKPIRQGWFRRQSKSLFTKIYSDAPQIFVFSHAWFTNFQKRWSISSRAITRKASKLPEEYQQLILEWLRFNRRNSQPRNSLERHRIISDIGRFRYSNILNLDETPIPFEYLDGRTFDITGNKTISVKTQQSGWDKRQATLILYIFADGIPRIKPKLIFHGSNGPNAKLRATEGHRYHPGVTIEYNRTAYNNESLFLQFIDQELIPTLHTTTPNGISTCISGKNTSTPPTTSLLILDAAAFHTTEAVLARLKDAHIIPSLIPGGCTGLIQPLDTTVNKPFKAYLRDYTDQYIDEQEALNPALASGTGWSVGEKRIMTTHVVANAWDQFCKDKKAMICKAFRDVGVTLPVDGSCDHELAIKGIDPSKLQIGDGGHNPLSDNEVLDRFYRSIPISDDDNELLEYTWSVEDYVHSFPVVDRTL